MEVARRDTKEKKSYVTGWVDNSCVMTCLKKFSKTCINKAKAFSDEHITKADNWDEFVKLLDEKGGFISAHWDGTAETEEDIKEITKATIRCIPLNNEKESGKCILTGKPALKEFYLPKLINIHPAVRGFFIY